MSIARVNGQKSGLSNAAAETIQVPFAQDVTLGNLLVFATASYQAQSTVASISYSGTATIGTIVQDIAYNNVDLSDRQQYVAIYSVPVTGTGSLTISFNQGLVSANFSSLALQEYSGADINSTRVSGTNTGFGNSTSPATGSLTSPAGGVFVGALAYNNEVGTTITHGTNFEDIYKTESLDYLPCSFEDYIVTNSVLSTANWTTGAAEPWANAVVCYKAKSTSSTGLELGFNF